MESLSDFEISHPEVESYINAILLSNFDNIISEKFSDLIGVDQALMNSYSPSLTGLKYKQEFKALRTAQWEKEAHSETSIEKHTSSFIKAIANIIPLKLYDYDTISKKHVSTELPGIMLGSQKISALGAILNSESSTFVLENGSIVTLADMLLQYDNGKITFEQILRNLLNDIDNKSSNKHTLYLHRATINSISDFLYSPDKGLVKLYNDYIFANTENTAFIINPEVAIINFIRSTVGVTARFESTSDNGRSINALNIDSNVENVLSEMYSEFKSN